VVQAVHLAEGAAPGLKEAGSTGLRVLATALVARAALWDEADAVRVRVLLLAVADLDLALDLADEEVEDAFLALAPEALLLAAALAEALALRWDASLASAAQTCVAVTDANRQQTANQALRNFIIIPRVASRDPTSSTVRQPAQA
jgi:hypothetical protein